MTRPRSSTSLAAGLMGLLAGLVLSTTWSLGEIREVAERTVQAADLEEVTRASAMPRTRLALAMAEARSSLAADRPWAAWTALRDQVEDPDRAPAPAALLAARAAAGWEGWEEVRSLLRGRDWLATEGAGEGLYLLGRGEEEAENWAAAADAYGRYLRHPQARSTGVVQARLGRALAQTGRTAEAAAAFGAAAEQLGPIRDWMRALQAEALAAEGSPSVMTIAATASGASAPARMRQARAEASFWLERGDTVRAIDRLGQEARALQALGGRTEAAALLVDRAGHLARHRRPMQARDDLRTVAADSAVHTDTRLRAATRLAEVATSRTAEEEIARASALEAAGKPGLAARALRSARSAGADSPALRLRIGELLFQERDYGPARVALRDAAAVLDPARAAEAELLAARALARSGDRAAALRALRAVVESHPGTPASGTALFHLGDMSSDRQAAIALYRRAAAVPASERAREALFRVGDRSLKADDRAGALRAWEEYVRRYPQGEETARVAYNVGVMHERAGNAGAARAMYTAAIAAEPLSYHALRAGERAGVDPLERAVAARMPWIGVASDASEVADALSRLQALEVVGLEGAWQQELDASIRRFSDRQAALLALAEGLRDGGHSIEAVRLGRRLLALREGAWDERLMRVVFPFPYREMVEEVAEDVGVDPMLIAGLARQESSWNPEARSWVGATGLTQIMPGTGRWLARGVGVYDFEVRHLEVPEVNLRMGAKYLRDQLRRYDGARDLALAAYNAGPGRADRWRRELGYGGDVDAFRERIPFDETRHYVQVVLRNAAVYERLYGEERGPGLVRN